MLVRILRKANLPTLLVGMQIATDTTENSIKVPLELPYDLVVLRLSMY